MTPLALWLSTQIPQKFVPPALAALYAAMILGLLLFGRTGDMDIAYIDVGWQQ